MCWRKCGMQGWLVVGVAWEMRIPTFLFLYFFHKAPLMNKGTNL
jgi:hypothetical protein